MNLTDWFKGIIAWLRGKILIILDVEGPCLFNDNAYETLVALAKRYRFWSQVAPHIVITPLPEEEGMTLGEIIASRFYKRLSNIDDIWGDFGKVATIDPSYSSGHTVKIALAFDRALGGTAKWMYEFAKESIRAMPGIVETLANLNRKYVVWMVSTSYSFFIQAFCDLVGFDFTRAYCTFVPEFDEIPISRKESRMLLRFMKEVAATPVIEYNEKTGDVIEAYRVHYDRFTDFIWYTLYKMPAGKLLRVVHPVGQAQKREAAEEIQQRIRIPKKRIIGYGDSQTDVQVAEWLNKEGLMVMVNGKGKVCDKSHLMYIGNRAEAMEEIADRFAWQGQRSIVHHYRPFRQAKQGGKIAAVTPDRVEKLKQESVEQRKNVRGVQIGSLP